ncbi:MULTISPECIES: hypothetical protein [Grimontia]|uniref:Uncharacterized protein n=1 Tax=Grimontia marina TaxID=646534 RepID=A0A128FA62_9GAMM|nr:MULTISPECIES: hypothetical protein [Grimontia]WRV96387.1 hypothetical protein VP504_09605 [Grimontia sp. NTOU-MAR1]CZF83672.1 hypothetical protein GMA8713_02760 [Grimontia marina]
MSMSNLKEEAICFVEDTLAVDTAADIEQKQRIAEYLKRLIREDNRNEPPSPTH